VCGFAGACGGFSEGAFLKQPFCAQGPKIIPRADPLSRPQWIVAAAGHAFVVARAGAVRGAGCGGGRAVFAGVVVHSTIRLDGHAEHQRMAEAFWVR
jgi:hypothetical protein